VKVTKDVNDDELIESSVGEEKGGPKSKSMFKMSQGSQIEMLDTLARV